MVRGLIIPADTHKPLEVRDFVSLEDYQAVVRGWIEGVDIQPLDSALYVNENGIAMRLPFNPRATFLWWYEIPSARHRARLLGDAVLVGFTNSGDHVDLPESTFRLLTEMEPYGVLVRVDDDPKWRKHPLPYDDFFDAVVWAMALSDEVTGATQIRVVTYDQLTDVDREELPISPWDYPDLPG